MVTLAPARGEVQVWLEWIDDAPAASGMALLDDDERARADRFHFERDRRRFVARRAFLRRVLGGYVDVAPRHLRYRTSPTGKPELAEPRGVAFNTSHADGLAVVAVGVDGQIGVDVERARPIPDSLDLARGLFSARERDRVESTPPSMRAEAFLRIWTRKEAYVKFVGRGLSMPLDAFDVLGSRVRPSDAVETLPRLRALELPDGYLGAVALTGETVTYPQPTPIEMAS
jgi:4'-phosphopantetheinyl transferase